MNLSQNTKQDDALDIYGLWLEYTDTLWELLIQLFYQLAPLVFSFVGKCSLSLNRRKTIRGKLALKISWINCRGYRA